MTEMARDSGSGHGGDLQAFKAAFFRALAHPVRIRLLEELVRGERSVHDLQVAIGLEQPVVSQQLGVLRTGNVVVGRKAGVQVRYRLRDPLVADLLTLARQIFNNQLAGSQTLLRQLRKEHRQQQARR
jgi:ArsR family transcriptional regulator